MRCVQLVGTAKLVDADAGTPPLRDGEIRVAVHAAGICHSDAHYRRGMGNITYPRTLGHEVAGVVAELGPGVEAVRIGDRVAIHYLRSCGACERCVHSGEQFCVEGAMFGKELDGGYAESIVVPAVNAIPIPDDVPLEVAAVMMCSTATAYHALRIADMREGARVLILGFGGLGYSALQLARALGAATIGVVDLVPEKLALARSLGAIALTEIAGEYDIALDFAGHPALSVAALRALAPGGRLVVVALSEAPLDFNPYRDVLAKERRIIGSSDHTREELVALLQLASEGRIDLAPVITRRIELSADAINGALDELDRGTAGLRTVISSAGRK
ncbi:MAG TPA: alcohol dehydrogenase catalytic domain-containing protein [Thermoanaerobaculia bacterium]|jgi:propanol-preferring alcohol dehydrogenase